MSTVLLAEDSAPERARIANALERAGHRVDPAATRAAVRSVAERQRVDIAVVSGIEPDSEDLQLVRILRARFTPKELPILVLCAEPSVRARLAAHAAGASDHLARPFELSQLLARVADLLGQRVPWAADTPDPQTSSRRILVVDDSRTYAHALMDELRNDKHDVAFAESGTEALEFLEAQPTDLAIIDVFLPDLSGIDVCRKIKVAPATAGMPVLVLTGRERSAVRSAAEDALADDFAVKGRDFAAICAKVRQLLVRSAAGPVTARTAAALREGAGDPASSKRRPLAPPAGDAAAPREGAGDPASSKRRSFPSPAGNTTLFADVVRETGLSDMLAKSAVERVCNRLQIAPHELTKRDLPRVVAELAKTLQLFLPAEEAEARIEALKRMVG